MLIDFLHEKGFLRLFPDFNAKRNVGTLQHISPEASHLNVVFRFSVFSINIRGHGSVRFIVVSQAELKGSAGKPPVFVITSVDIRAEVSEPTELVVPIGEILSEVVAFFEVLTEPHVSVGLHVEVMAIVV